MNFHEGDPVMHWNYGLGQIIRLDGGLVTTVYYKSEDSRAEWW